MMTKATISVLIGVAVYLVGLGIFCLIKRHKYKKQLKKDTEKYEQEEDSTEVKND